MAAVASSIGAPGQPTVRAATPVDALALTIWSQRRMRGGSGCVMTWLGLVANLLALPAIGVLAFRLHSPGRLSAIQHHPGVRLIAWGSATIVGIVCMPGLLAQRGGVHSGDRRASMAQGPLPARQVRLAMNTSLRSVFCAVVHPVPRIRNPPITGARRLNIGGGPGGGMGELAFRCQLPSRFLVVHNPPHRVSTASGHQPVAGDVQASAHFQLSLVHRLDRDTSGLLVVARDPDSP